MKHTIITLLLLQIVLIFGQTHSAMDGDYLYPQLQHAPFPNADRNNGHYYKKRFFSFADHYNDSTVGIYIPENFNTEKTIDLIVHFHGWNNEVRRVISKFELDLQLEESGKNAILICPQGPKNSCDSSGGNLETKGEFTLFINEIMHYLKKHQYIEQKAKPGKIILSGHSGAYRVIASILGNKDLKDNIREVYLFDATYATPEEFVSWSTSKNMRRMVSIFTEHLATENYHLAAQIQEKKKKVSLLPLSSFTPKSLKKELIIFSYTTLGHNDVIHRSNAFRQLLSTSSLNDK